MPFRPDRLTEKTQEAIQQAQTLAQEAQHQEITPEHLLFALLQQQDGTVRPILQQIGVDPARVEAELKTQLDRLPKVYGAETYLGSRLRRLLDAAWNQMEGLKDEYLSTEHLLLAITDEANSEAAKMLQRAGVTRDKVLEALTKVRGSTRVTDASPESKFQALEKYGVDTVHAAIQEIFSEAERRCRAVVARIPDGEYTAEASYDDDSVTEEPVRIHAKVTVRGGDMTIDLSGCSQQRTGGSQHRRDRGGRVEPRRVARRTGGARVGLGVAVSVDVHRVADRGADWYSDAWRPARVVPAHAHRDGQRHVAVLQRATVRTPSSRAGRQPEEDD